MLETALTRLLRHRVADADQHGLITLSVRTLGDGERPALVFSVVDRPVIPAVADGDVDVDVDADPEPRAVRATVAALGGRVRTIADPAAGRVTAIELPAAPAT
jgi:hypothetical protein